MKSLFAKILVWFLFALLVTAVGFTVTTAYSLAGEDRQPPLAKLVTFQFQEARHAYESGGRERLAEFERRLESVFEGDAVLTDAQGRDLLTGENHADWIRSARLRGRWPLLHSRRTIFTRRSEDGRYWFFLRIPHERVGFWFLLPQHLWVIGAAMLLCYGLAYYLSRPVTRLQQAVERFGRGDLSARAAAARGDEFGELARAFNQMAERIQTLLEAERRLLLDISHELRSPLARLAVAVELARSGEDREQALDRIQKEADRLNDLVGQLLQVTRAEGDPSSLRESAVRLDKLLSELAADSALEASARGCRVEWGGAPPVETHGDPELLRRAIENVLRNAIRYAPPGTAVELKLHAESGLASIEVRDYGPGVPPESVERIFDPFYRVQSGRERSSGGVGLGLSIARRALVLHHGRIHAENADPGLRVRIDLPLA